MKQPVKYILTFGIFLAMFAGRTEKVFSQDVDYKAYTLFLYNFMKYIEWPPDQAADFVIGVVGDCPIKKDLQTLAETKKAKGKKITIKIINATDDALSCNMVFIPSAKSSQLKPIAEKIKGKPILIVAEREGLAKKGAAISFAVNDDDALQFDFNKTVLDGQSLKIANLLMQLGELVG
jgi:hypothetical protein